MGWAEKRKKKERQEMTYQATINITVRRLVQAGQGLTTDKAQIIEVSGTGGTPGDAVDAVLGDGIEEFVLGLSRVVPAVVLPGPTRVGQ